MTRKLQSWQRKLAIICAWARRGPGSASLTRYESESVLNAIDRDFSSPIVLRVFRADPTPLDQLENPDLLRPPALEKNFLISPPGSPPAGWEQIREEPPNSTPLADDLIVALRKLQLEREGSGKNQVEVLIEPEEGVGISICVEDCGDDTPMAQDEDTHHDWISTARSALKSSAPFKPIPTAMPPLPAHA